MKLYLDSARLHEVDAVVARGVASGVTTNPTFLWREAGSHTLGHLVQIVELLRPHGLPLFVQVMTTSPNEMLRQAETFQRELAYQGLAIKVPCGWDELKVVAELARRGIGVNCTVCMTPMQVLMAAAAGARWATLYYSRMGDAGIDPLPAIESAATGLRRQAAPCELIVASIRTTAQVHDCLRVGADIVTLPYLQLMKLSEHAKSREAVSLFSESFVEVDPVDPPSYTASSRSSSRLTAG